MSLSIRKNVITEEKIQKKIKNGDGQGEGVNYRPYIRVGDFSSTGRVHRVLSLDGRIQHFFSDLEKDYYYHLLWEDRVIEIKEQYPLDREATTRIAASLGIKHPTDPKTGVPIVMTTDFFITALLGGKKRSIARSIKFQTDLNKKRVQEKQTLEKLYWKEKGIEWGIVTEQSFDRKRSRNIQFLMNYYRDETVEDLPNMFLPILVERFISTGNERLAQVCSEIDEKFGLQKGKTLGATYYYAAHKVLPLRLDNRWNTWRVDEIIDMKELQQSWEEGQYGENRALGG